MGRAWWILFTQSTYLGYQAGKMLQEPPANTAFGVRALGTQLCGDQDLILALGSEATQGKLRPVISILQWAVAHLSITIRRLQLAVGLGALSQARVGTSLNTAVGEYALGNASENFATHTATN